MLATDIVFPQHMTSAAPNFLTAGEVMTPVKELRSIQGLQPYWIDPGATAYSQELSEYQASTGVSSLLHTDNLTSISLGCVENVAGGDMDI